MKHLIKTSVLALIALFSTSCEKTDNEVASVKQILTAKLYEKNNGIAANLKSISYELTDGKVTSVNGETKYTFEYTGGVISKVLYSNNGSAYKNITYNQDGSIQKIITDPGANFANHTVEDFSYNGNQVLITETQRVKATGLTVPNTLVFSKTITINNNNVTSAIFEYGNQKDEYLFEYDTTSTLYSSISNSKNIFFVLGLELGYVNHNISNNNKTKQTANTYLNNTLNYSKVVNYLTKRDSSSGKIVYKKGVIAPSTPDLNLADTGYYFVEEYTY